MGLQTWRRLIEDYRGAKGLNYQELAEASSSFLMNERRIVKKYLKIDELAEERGYNVHSLHIASGLAYNSVHSLWRNKSMRADFETLEKMARALNVSIGDLFYDMGEIKEWQRRGERQGVNDADEPC